MTVIFWIWHQRNRDEGDVCRVVLCECPECSQLSHFCWVAFYRAFYNAKKGVAMVSHIQLWSTLFWWNAFLFFVKLVSLHCERWQLEIWKYWALSLDLYVNRLTSSENWTAYSNLKLNFAQQTRTECIQCSIYYLNGSHSNRIYWTSSNPFFYSPNNSFHCNCMENGVTQTEKGWSETRGMCAGVYVDVDVGVCTYGIGYQ